MDINQLFHGPNVGYLEELYERFLVDPYSVDEATRTLFAEWTPPYVPTAAAESHYTPNGHAAAPVASSPAAVDKIVGLANLAKAIRQYGHMAAHLDPLGHYDPPGDRTLKPTAHSLDEGDLRRLPGHVVGGPIASRVTNAYEGIEALREVYCQTIGYEYEHIYEAEERSWLRDMAESRHFHPRNQPDFDLLGLLERLTQVEAFEMFLHRIYPGKTRFSIEGLDTMVPVLDEIIGDAAENGVYNVLIGMAHRGRLNVLAHVLEKPYAQILAEFKDPMRAEFIGNSKGWFGDVKYHEGARRYISSQQTYDLEIMMVPNPSHLEHVNPVTMGMARAAGTKANQPGPAYFDKAMVLPIIIHGDAAFPGQGVVAETLNLYALRGYRCGGTIHIIANNQLGFTTNAWASRSTLYASDLAKGFRMPVVHVNADDPEACIEVARVAAAYRFKYQKDFVIDLIGYRRYGHNEGDEPRFTQPRMYHLIDNHPTVRNILAGRLIKEGKTSSNFVSSRFDAVMKSLQNTLEKLQGAADLPQVELKPAPPGAAKKTITSYSADGLRELNRALMALPEGFTLNTRLQRIRKRMETALDNLDERAIDWGQAEMLAFATIIASGTAIRLTGEDVERGTFSHRHAILKDADGGPHYIPLQVLPQAQASFEVRNSALSESAAVGFEYGYSIQAPDRLVLWEAQYGDFVNVAQSMIDEFLVSGQAKWNQKSGMVMLLPHGFEGQGPDHSSARPERFLQLAGQTNMRIANPTTAAQYFHLLRRQARLLTDDPLPLIVMTPKGLLRHTEAMSSLRDLAEGKWQPVLDDATVAENREGITRLILCSGKVYVDLITAESRPQIPEVALVRVEQLYPAPLDELQRVVAGYPQLQEVIWMQEEPQNMGAWEFLRPQLSTLLDGRLPLGYIGRPRLATTSEGSSAWHKYNQDTLVKRAYNKAPVVTQKTFEFFCDI
ncbi:MAG: 2-oxoglutarate dehydrogenase E1 component [Chloroflexi bacterium]|nr:2-oxoglutarate dehydrogenase E1 component [Chloroflexota bacterium]MBP8056102.1 2-oxoglutarate dehydrogenase E1 component [Chloroflexota bacterium]